jgi:hypothetical protein
MMEENVGASQFKPLLQPLYNVNGWMKFAGIMTIIMGGLQVLSLWGIIIAWLPIWMGILILKSAGNIERAFSNNSEQEIIDSMTRLGRYFKIYGIFAIVMTIVVILGIIAAIMIPVITGIQQGAIGS